MEQNNTDYDTHTNFLEEIADVMMSSASSMDGLLTDFSSLPAFLDFQSDVARLSRETNALRDTMGSGLFNPNRAAALAQEVNVLRETNRSLQVENEILRKRLHQTKECMGSLRSSLQHEVDHCALLGATLCSHLWKASQEPSVVTHMVSHGIEDFLNILNVALVSFVDTHKEDMPPDHTNERKYVVSMCAIYTNLTAFSEGRQFLITSPRGQAVLLQFIAVLPTIPVPSGNSLIKMLLMGLYNMSINQSAHQVMLQQPDMLAGISNSLQESTTPENNMLGLKLLKSLCFFLQTRFQYRNMEQAASMERLKKLSTTGPREMKTLAEDILGILQVCKLKYNNVSCGKVFPFGS